MSAAATNIEHHRKSFLIPTVTKQCWGFMIGSAFFALGSAPGLSESLGTAGANLLFFVGAWFFTTAGLIQLFLSGAIAVPVSYAPGRMVRAEWLAAATQSFGTLMFNVSTTAALYAKSISAQEHFVWNPDAGGSVAFLVSGVLAFIAYARVARLWDIGRAAWWSVLINFIGCVAFGVSAVGAYILPSGSAISGSLANSGTFIGAICFLLASLVVLPQWNRSKDRHARAGGGFSPVIQ
ncbi:uncharacterized membrane protein YhaH (DUF805 family) [Agromyces hippuratus]|uniref:Uncharacterized membrane protein YhaH (DUF805 family) n=2 Tax=Agromyces hippuratus TaxID=286438 RepID=A0A852X8U0_9MICO|nr:hypothetical protein [Agromyces hippuratus]NYG22361.1 uncharacterized membrane protein YhaH (DUF805 family) [Agromyces hippuratus]